MDFLKKIKDEAKKSIEKIDWEQVDSKKNDALDKVMQFKDEYENQKRARMEDELYVKEIELNEKERLLLAKEKKLIKKNNFLFEKEKKLKSIQNKPKHVFFACLAIGILIYLFSSINFLQIERNRLAKKSNISIEFKKQSQSNTEIKSISNSYDYPKKIDSLSIEVAKVFNGLEIQNNDFDIGNYCLNVEKEGLLSLKECIDIAVLKAK